MFLLTFIKDKICKTINNERCLNTLRKRKKYPAVTIAWISSVVEITAHCEESLYAGTQMSLETATKLSLRGRAVVVIRTMKPLHKHFPDRNRSIITINIRLFHVSQIIITYYCYFLHPPMKVLKKKLKAPR